MTSKLQIRPEEPDDKSAIDALLAATFGPGTLARAAFRVREQVPHDPDLAFAGFCGDRLVASVRLTPIAIGKTPGLLLGPLVVDPLHENNGYGRALVAHALEAARAQGYGWSFWSAMRLITGRWVLPRSPPAPSQCPARSIRRGCSQLNSCPA